MEISVSTLMPDDTNCHVIEALEARPLRGRRGCCRGDARAWSECFGDRSWVGMAPSQLFGWRRQALARGEVSIADGDQPMTFTRFEAARSAPVEIVIGDVVVRAGPDVGADHLAAVVRAVRAA